MYSFWSLQGDYSALPLGRNYGYSGIVYSIYLLAYLLGGYSSIVGSRLET